MTEDATDTDPTPVLETIADRKPASIRQTAALVDRDYKDVHRNLSELEALGVIEFVSEGTSKRPRLRDGAEQLDISFRFGESGDPDRDAEQASI